MMDNGDGPLCPPGAGDPWAVVQPLHALTDRQPLLDHPGVELAHHGRFIMMNIKAGGRESSSGLVSVAVGCAVPDDVPLTGPLQLATSEALGQDRTLVFGDGALDL